MYVINSLIAAMIIHIQLVQSQHQVALEEVKTSPYRCGEELELKCTYTGNNAWDSNANRIWMDNQTLLMSNGVVSASLKGKYQEGEINTSKKYFILIIKNIMDADLKKNYICSYGIETLQTAVIIGGSCVNCMTCVRDCILYGLLGLLVGFIIELLVNYTCLFAKNHKVQATLVGIEGLLITVLVAGLIGYYICPCQPTRSPWCILIGFFFGITFLLILLYQYKFVHKDGESLCHLISLAVLTFGIWIAVKKCTNGRK